MQKNGEVWHDTAGHVVNAHGGADVAITKPYIRWLFGGFGFQNSEANFVALMPDDWWETGMAFALGYMRGIMGQH